MQTQTAPVSGHPATPYVAPFAVFIGCMALERLSGFPPQYSYPVRFVVVVIVVLTISRRVVTLRPRFPLASVLIGIGVLAIWVGPDLLWPAYRHHWLFENAVTGRAESTLTSSLQRNVLFLAIRTAGSALLVPVVEELFWRGWLMRWLIDRRFWELPIGAYTANSFWTVAVLFASEHGPYWEVGLAAGIVYNWWAIRTRSLADCILAHAVTNACLACIVMGQGQWQFWL